MTTIPAWAHPSQQPKGKPQIYCVADVKLPGGGVKPCRCRLDTLEKGASCPDFNNHAERPIAYSLRSVHGPDIARYLAVRQYALR